MLKPFDLQALFIFLCIKVALVTDPACGSGGFLLHALDYMRTQAKEFYDRETQPVEYFNYWHDFAAKHLYGIEINDEIARVAKMNMIVHDDGHTNVISFIRP